MGLGGATEKLQRVANMGEELYGRINELREQIIEMRETLQETHAAVRRLDHQVDQQQVLIEALAEEQGLDVDALLTEVAIEEAEPDDDEVETTDMATIESDDTDAEAIPGAESTEGGEDTGS